MIIHLAADHAGFAHKEAILVWLREAGYEVVDHGAFVYHELDDFPDFIPKALGAVQVGGSDTRAVIFGGSGQGEAMVANRFPNVRAAVFYGGEPTIPALSRQHNDSNVLSIGARFVSVDDTKKYLWEWLHTDPSIDEKYHRRNEKIELLTKQLHP